MAMTRRCNTTTQDPSPRDGDMILHSHHMALKDGALYGCILRHNTVGLSASVHETDGIERACVGDGTNDSNLY